MKVVGVEELQACIPRRVRWFNRFEFVDSRYWIPDLRQCQEIAVAALSKDPEYTPDRYDCDDFSAWLYCVARTKFGTNCFGRVLDPVSRHSYNVCVDASGRFWIVEPQTAQFMTLNERPKKFYSMFLAQIIW